MLLLLIRGTPKQCLARYVVLIMVCSSVTSAAPAVYPQQVTVTPRTARTVPTNRLTTVEWEAYHEHEHEGPGSYSFGYDVQDEATGNVQFREETRDADGTVRGSYGLLEPDGNVRIIMNMNAE
ncbi:hypothetical protein B566_EDAN008643 [Ephemera danica]|nr:hypothetical protein B566_EDAN008643 [Ephemera danica]